MNVVVALLLCTVLAILVWKRRSDSTPLRVTLPVLLVAVALVATLLQGVPLPFSLLERLSPGAHDLRSLDPTALAPLTLDAPATAHSLIILVALVAAAAIAAELFCDKRGRQELLRWLALAGGIVMLFGLVHSLAELRRPWGLFGAPSDHFSASFVNPNHLAGFLGLCSIASIGLAITAVTNVRWAYLANAVMTGAGVVLTLSRGGIICYVGAIGFLGLSLLAMRSRRLRDLAWLQLGLAAALLVGGFVTYARLVHEMEAFGEKALAKTAIWEPVPEMLRDFPVAGVGRGAFASVYPRYRPPQLTATYTHLENEFLQTLVDWGPGIGMALIVISAIIFIQILRRMRGDRTAAVAATALLFLAVHDIGDFCVEVTSVAVPAVMLAAAFYPRTRNDNSESDATGRKRRRTFGLVGLGALVLIVLGSAWPAIGLSVARDTRRLDVVLQQEKKTEVRLALAREIIQRHPADYLLPAKVGQRELREPRGAARALHWLNRSLYLAPHWAPPHRLTGRALRALGVNNQALSEYRVACEIAPAETEAVLNEVWRLFGDPEAIVRFGRSDDLYVRRKAAFFLLRHDAPESVLKLVADPAGADHPALLELSARAHMRLRQLDRATAVARILVERWPRQPTGYVLEANILARRGDRAAALETLREAVSVTGRQYTLQAATTTLLLRQGDWLRAREAARKLMDLARGSHATAEAHWLLGRTFQTEGRHAMALREYRRARELHPKRARYRLAIAAVREAIGDADGARHVLTRAKDQIPDSPELDAALDRLSGADP